MSAKMRLTLWVTFQVLLLAVMVLVFILVINRHSLPDDPLLSAMRRELSGREW